VNILHSIFNRRVCKNVLAKFWGIKKQPLITALRRVQINSDEIPGFGTTIVLVFTQEEERK